MLWLDAGADAEAGRADAGEAERLGHVHATQERVGPREPRHRGVRESVVRFRPDLVDGEFQRTRDGLRRLSRTLFDRHSPRHQSRPRSKTNGILNRYCGWTLTRAAARRGAPPTRAPPRPGCRSCTASTRPKPKCSCASVFASSSLAHARKARANHHISLSLSLSLDSHAPLNLCTRTGLFVRSVHKHVSARARFSTRHCRAERNFFHDIAGGARHGENHTGLRERIGQRKRPRADGACTVRFPLPASSNARCAATLIASSGTQGNSKALHAHI